MRVVFTEPAGKDLEAIGDWIAKDNPLRAACLVRELRGARDYAQILFDNDDSD